MEKKEYLELLENAYKELPEVLQNKKRFEVPKVKGKLIKTRTYISNFGEITKIFDRDSNHLFKFFLKEVAVRAELNKEKGELILYSRSQPEFLNKIIEKYFKEYVRCSYCKSPDTILVDDVGVECKACGHKQEVFKI